MVVAVILGSLGFSFKKAIASNKVAVQIMINPIRGIIAPMSSSNPAVANRPTFDFSESCFSERLIKKAAAIANNQTRRRTTINPATKGIISDGLMFAVLGVSP